jgi:hypothetical protein
LRKRFHLSLFYLQMRICHLCRASQRCRMPAIIDKEAQSRYSHQTKPQKTKITASTYSEKRQSC